MRAFLHSIDESIWNYIIYGWELPITTKDNEIIVKSRNECIIEDTIGNNWNEKDINAIFGIVSPQILSYIQY